MPTGDFAKAKSHRRKAVIVACGFAAGRVVRCAADQK